MPGDLTTTCPGCGQQKASDLIGHRHTGAQCYWCGHSTDRDLDPKAAHPATLPPGSRSVDPADTGVGRSFSDGGDADG